MRALPVALAVLCVLAGCSGLAPNAGEDGPTTDRTTVTPAEVPRDLHGGTIAPGLTRDRLVNATALVGANRAALRNESLTLRWNGTILSTDRDGNVTVTPSQSVVRLGPARQRIHYAYVYEGTWRNVSRTEMWLGADRGLRMDVTDGTREYERLQPQVADVLRRFSFDARGLSGVDRVTVERTGTTEGGHDLYRVRAVDPSLPDRSFGARDRFETRNVSLVTTVDERGVIHRYRFSYDIRAEDGGEWHRVRRLYEIRAVGETTVERPDWYDAAVSAVGNETTTR